MKTNTDQPKAAKAKTEAKTEAKTGAKPNAKHDLRSLLLEEVEKIGVVAGRPIHDSRS
jgi:hypothetical protein